MTPSLVARTRWVVSNWNLDSGRKFIPSAPGTIPWASLYLSVVKPIWRMSLSWPSTSTDRRTRSSRALRARVSESVPWSHEIRRLALRSAMFEVCLKILESGHLLFRCKVAFEVCSFGRLLFHYRDIWIYKSDWTTVSKYQESTYSIGHFLGLSRMMCPLLW